jgi:ABC-type sugar transport system ATPase subunit
MCDRIAILAEGRLAEIFTSEEATEEKIMTACCMHPALAAS